MYKSILIIFLSFAFFVFSDKITITRTLVNSYLNNNIDKTYLDDKIEITLRCNYILENNDVEFKMYKFNKKNFLNKGYKQYSINEQQYKVINNVVKWNGITCGMSKIGLLCNKRKYTITYGNNKVIKVDGSDIESQYIFKNI